MKSPSLLETVLLVLFIIGALITHDTLVKQRADITTLQHEQAVSADTDTRLDDFAKKQQDFDDRVGDWAKQNQNWQQGIVDFLNGGRDGKAQGKKAAR